MVALFRVVLWVVLPKIALHYTPLHSTELKDILQCTIQAPPPTAFIYIHLDLARIVNSVQYSVVKLSLV